MRIIKLQLVKLVFFFVIAVAMAGSFVLVTAQATNAVAPRLSVVFTCAQAVDYRSGQVCVHTQPGAALTIRVRYCTGAYAVSRSLQGVQFSDRLGNHMWSWVPNTRCRGAATVFVSERYAGHLLAVSRVFTVR